MTTEKEIEILSLFLTNGDNKKIQPNDLDNPFMSWDILMEVVEKIESLPNELCNKYFWNTEGKQRNDFRIFRVQKINDLYNQCVEFIKWYNEQKKD